MKNKLLNLFKLAASFGLMWGLGYLAHQKFSWWITAVVAAAVCFFVPVKNGGAFAMGFAAFSLLWGLQANALNALNMELLATKMGALFGGVKPMQLVYATGVVGGLLGAFGAVTGSSFRQIFFPLGRKKNIDVSRSEAVVLE
ncbi:MAG: hypothetical protein AAF960_02210 [Bacteroidota bacterium]